MSNFFGDAANGALIPVRKEGSVTGSQFIQNNLNISGSVREQNILNEFLNGNIPDFLRKFVPITVSLGSYNLSFLSMSDYLSIGTDEDYVRVPMNPLTAQKIADKYDCTLPTKKMVDDIWRNSVNRLTPLPWGPPYDASMMSTERISIHNTRIQSQLTGKDNKALTSGHKKDVVLTNKLSPNNQAKRVAIYGWIQPDGKPIQSLNPVSHEDTYADYSHGIRLISRDVIVNGNFLRIEEVFKDPSLSSMISNEGILSFLRY